MKKTIALAALAALVAACGGDEEPATGDSDSAAGVTVAAPVVLGAQDIATAATRAISSAVVVSGNLDPAEVVQLRAQIPGTVQGVRVDRGSAVRRGTVLATIAAAGVRTQAAAARAQEAVARQRLEASKRLYEAGAISAIEYQSAQASYEAARAATAAASESAAHATIASPINGVVSARFVSGGEAVNPGTALFTVVNASVLELAGRVGVQDAARVRPGQPVTFTLDAMPNQVYRGSVARVDPTADPGTRQVGVYVRLPNPGNRIVGGQFARGRIETGATQSAVVIPEAAITARSGSNGAVFVLTGNRVARRMVTLGERDDATGLVAVAAGIQSGERVLLNPSPDIGDGTVVSIAAETAAPDTAR